MGLLRSEETSFNRCPIARVIVNIAIDTGCFKYMACFLKQKKCVLFGP